MAVYILALLLTSLALWFLISATRVSASVHESCHPVGGELWSIFVVMMVVYVFAIVMVYLYCGGNADPDDLLAPFSTGADDDAITPEQCQLSVALALFMLLSVPLLGYAISTFLFDPVEPEFMQEFYEHENNTLATNTTDSSTPSAYEHGDDCLVRSRRPGVYIIFAILMFYLSLGLIGLGKCMWHTRRQRLGREDISSSDSDDSSSDDFTDSASAAVPVYCDRCRNEIT